MGATVRGMGAAGLIACCLWMVACGGSGDDPADTTGDAGWQPDGTNGGGGSGPGTGGSGSGGLGASGADASLGGAGGADGSGGADGTGGFNTYGPTFDLWASNDYGQLAGGGSCASSQARRCVIQSRSSSTSCP